MDQWERPIGESQTCVRFQPIIWASRDIREGKGKTAVSPVVQRLIIMSGELEQRIAEAQARAESYQEKIRRQKEQMADTTLTEFAYQTPNLPRNNMRVRRLLRGHSNKIYSIQWSLDSQSLVSASQDGKLLVWDPRTAGKEYVITLRSSWVMTCAYSPSRKYVAAGGLDNLGNIYDLAKVDAAMTNSRSGIPDVKPDRELVGHIGFIAGCRFRSDNELLTCSGDTTCVLWDVERGLPKTTFRGHTADVMNISLLAERDDPSSANTFVSVGCDATARIWDMRTGCCTRIYVGHESDINAVDAFPTGYAFATGSDDRTCRMYDLRADRELMRYYGNDIESSVTSIGFSKSGRALFVAYDDTNVLVWDTLKSVRSGILAAHDSRVSCLGVSPDGYALATASWDSNIKIWA